ncbi:MAG: hypothetical protein DRN00_01050 [Thermoplasmata archaeon]|nr:MAG: hypothetical protein DRN00_01050 [Thermoplasmata archaeon]
MKKAIIFDFDGTLVDLHQDADMVRKRLRDVSRRYGYNLEFEKILEDIERIGAIDDQMKSILLDILNEEDLKLVNKATLIDSSNRICETLKERGFLIGIFTRNYSELVHRLLEKFSFPKFDIVLGRYEGGKNKQEQLIYILHYLDLEPHQAVVVGDYIGDIIAAKRVGCYTIGVESGRCGREELLRYGADEVIRDVGEILSVIE